MKPIYSIPKLKSYDDLSKTWYVWFRYNGQLIKKTQEINRIKDYKMRTVAGHALAKVYHDELKKGWNPLEPDIQIKANHMTFSEAIDFSMEKIKLRLVHKTYLDYGGTAKFCKNAAEKIGLASMRITDVRKVHIKLILEKARALAKRSWSNNTYNKHLGYLQAILSELIEWELIENNPAHKIKTLKVLESTANSVPTSDEHLKIKTCLIENNPDYFIFILVLFHTGMRPWEIAQLQFKMYSETTFEGHLERSFILPPTITKTEFSRVVPINNHLWDYLRPIFEQGHPPHYYIFAKHGKGKDFVPGEKRLSRRYSTDSWKELVKDGLGINVNQYAMKHFGADMKIIAGIDLDALRHLYGHSSKFTTEIYAKAVKRVYRKQIIENSPSF